MNNTVISLKNISKSYKMYNSPAEKLKEMFHPFKKTYHKDFWALQDVSFDVKKGESLGIIGCNGSGKSTLLKILCGVLQPTAGDVLVSGRISALLELGAGFNFEFTGRENVFMNGAIMGISQKEMEARFDAIVAFADIGEFIDQPLKVYSSGMYVRLAFACAINVDPDILIVDEALSVGDMGFQQKCYHQIETLLKDRGVTLVLVTHDLQMTKNYCTKAVYLKNGRVVSSGESEVVTEAYLKDTFRERFDGPGNSVNIESKESSAKARFGTAHGKIQSFSLWRGAEQTSTFEHGSTLTVKVAAWVDETVANPSIVIQIRDLRGYVVYGANSFKAGLKFPPDERQAGMIQAAFTFDVILAEGPYSFTFSLNDHISDSIIIPHDKLVGALDFNVFDERKIFHGVVNLNARCENILRQPS